MRPQYSILSLLVFFLTIFALIIPAGAQSGRRPKRSDTPAPTVQPPPKEEEPEPKYEPPPPPKEEPRIPLLVVADTPSLNLPTGVNNYVLGACVERMKLASQLSVQVGKELNRKQASDRAKEETETHVVWLQFDTENSDFNRSNINDLRVDYVVFTPGTGKIKYTGRVYLRPYQARQGIGVGGIALPLPRVPAGRSSLELSLQQAGIETADQVMAKFNIQVLQRRPY